ncbi:sensor histidine kinase [Litoreibacter janthinus]|uniref:histidine kinase n=1 Tax=Litoreibacter janthinus TaxID=670154 RepID=A0A1I6FWX7_9RHOB|nr:sensor histidine kinase [Litoreibacter janthinus]SFR34453.1 two-component system, OmpR family, sensor histidine kinase TctE [Litoreibacter janthinus]
MKLQSLRARLIVIILVPLLLISIVAGGWQFRNATQRAEEIFDRGLLSAALAISRDIALSGGDALSPATRSLVSDTSGGELFYHVFAPDGVFVIGYATPPVLPHESSRDLTRPIYYNARYQGNDVRVLRFQDATTVGGLAGIYSITVWQKAEVRNSFVREVVTRSFAVIALLVMSAAMVVWFGVAVGLRPLLDLEDAIARRTPSELQPIRRHVPIEARGLVSTLNALLDRVSRRISSKDEFISNAAHQLRNPVAGVLALAEAVQYAPDSSAMKERSTELVKAAKEASRLTNQLLSFERAKGMDMASVGKVLNFEAVIRDALTRFGGQGADVAVSFECLAKSTAIFGDEIMLKESLLNLLNNAVVHGGHGLAHVQLKLWNADDNLMLTIADDGIGIPPDKHVQAIGRFSQAASGKGSGLGLPIAAKVIESHGGRLSLKEPKIGTLIEIVLPVAQVDEDA